MQASTNPAGEQQFVRDRLTWLGYLLSATPTYVFGTFGPFMPFLRTELDLSYTTAAYHFTALAAGGAVAGMLGRTFMQKLGRLRGMWLAAVILGSAVISLISGHTAVVTIASALLIGCAGSLIGQCVASLMSDRFGVERTIGLIEQNITASCFCLSAPLMVFSAVRLGVGWRAALLLPLFYVATLFLVFRHTASSVEPKLDSGRHRDAAHLPAAYWAYWLVILLIVGSEWSVIFWSAEFLHTSVHLTKADAAAAVTTFLVAMLGGRICGRALATRFSTRELLPLSSFIAIGGFLTFWLAPTTAAKLVGLWITGLGISNFFPLTYSAALATAPDKSTIAASRMAMSTSGALISAPLILGFVADHRGIFTAYGVIAILLSICACMVLVANHLGAKHTALASSSTSN